MAGIEKLCGELTSLSFVELPSCVVVLLVLIFGFTKINIKESPFLFRH
jgi:hypothetical protein